MTFALTPSAEGDLAEIVDFIAMQASPDRADRVLDELADSMRKLADIPRMGHVRRDLAPDDGVRFWPAFALLIAYRADVVLLQVLRVVHGSRHPEPITGLLRDEDVR